MDRIERPPEPRRREATRDLDAPDDPRRGEALWRGLWVRIVALLVVVMAIAWLRSLVGPLER